MKRKARILVIDDEQGIRELLDYELSQQGHSVATAADGEEGLARIRAEPFDLVISDVRMPKRGGLELLAAVKQAAPGVEVIMATGYGTIETAVRAMKEGAYDFVQKPFQLDEIFALVEKALEKSELRVVLGVYESSRAVFETLSLETLLPLIVDAVRRILKASDASILLRREGRLELAACSGLTREERRRSRVALGEQVAGKVALMKAPVLIAGPVEEDPRFPGVRGLSDADSSIVCPLAAGGEILGVLNVNRARGEARFTETDLRPATIFAAQAAQAVLNARSYRRLEENAQELRRAYESLEASQAQLLQADKLAAIGRLAAGVAHEINNPLTGILGFAQILLEEGGLTAGQKELIESLHAQAQRCRRIVADLLQFGRRRETKREAVRVAEVLDSAVALARHDLCRARVQLSVEAAGGIPEIQADPFQLRQAFLNLIMNAMQAMEGREPASLRIRTEPAGGSVRVLFEDTGCGIPVEHQGRLFEPFFTTKEAGKGTGLGLSICHGIVTSHGGSISVESEPGKGTRLTVEFPASPDHERAQSPAG